MPEGTCVPFAAESVQQQTSGLQQRQASAALPIFGLTRLLTTPVGGLQLLTHQLARCCPPQTLDDCLVRSGVDTTAHTATWLLYMLISHADVQHKLLEELDGLGLLATPERPEPLLISSGDVFKLPYLQAIIKVPYLLHSAYCEVLLHPSYRQVCPWQT